jgi:hypothetical protein
MNVIAPSKPKAKISLQEMERRREALRQADASNRIEGYFPDPADAAIYEQFIRGEIELAEIIKLIQPPPLSL